MTFLVEFVALIDELSFVPPFVQVLWSVLLCGACVGARPQRRIFAQSRIEPKFGGDLEGG